MARTTLPTTLVVGGQVALTNYMCIEDEIGDPRTESVEVPNPSGGCVGIIVFRNEEVRNLKLTPINTSAVVTTDFPKLAYCTVTGLTSHLVDAVSRRLTKGTEEVSVTLRKVTFTTV